MKKILFAAPHFFSGFVRVGGQQYAKLLSKNNWKVIYSSNFLSPFNLLFGKNRTDIRMRFSNYLRGGENINENLKSHAFLTFLPHHNFTIFDRKWLLYNYYKFTFPQINKMIKKNSFKDVDVLWIDSPSQIFWKNIINFKKSIYRIPDAIEEFSKNREVIIKAHEDAIHSVDTVIVTSKVLINELKEKYKNVNFLYCPNGVDLSNFIKDKYHKPDEYLDIKGKIALYVGAIGEWFDEELLLYLADNSKDINFFIIGPDRTNKMKAIKKSNISYLGPKEYKDVPDYMYQADFGIIPFKSTKLVRCVNPIKLYEFFSLGKQVVSVSWEELELLKSPCLLAKNSSEFLELIHSDMVIHPDHSCLTNYANRNTWESRLRDILKLIN